MARPLAAALLVGLAFTALTHVGAQPLAEPPAEQLPAPLPEPPEGSLPEPAAEPVAEPPSVLRIEAALDRPVRCEFENTPLEDVTAFLAEQAKIPIVVDERSLDEMGIGVDAPVTLRLKGASLRSVLRHVLRELDLTWYIRDEVLLITTLEMSESTLITRVLPVRDLIGVDDEQAADDLSRLVRQTVAPNSWAAVGGPASLEVYRGMLLISDTRQELQEVVQLLDALRKAAVSQPGGSLPVVSPAPAESKIGEALDNNVHLEFRETPLSDVVQFIAAAHEINVLIDGAALDDVGIPTNSPITLHVKGISLRSALRLLLRPHDLTCVIRDEALVITTPEEYELSNSIRIYPVTDLLDVEGDDASRKSERLAALAEVIVTTVEPNSWNEVGGPGSLVPYGRADALVCTQTDDVHEQVAELLARLRSADQAGPPATDAAPASETVVYRLAPAQGTETIPPADLRDLIEELVAPGAWKRADAFVKVVPGRVVVRHNRRVQRQVAGLLAELGLIVPQAAPEDRPGAPAAGAGFFRPTD